MKRLFVLVGIGVLASSVAILAADAPVFKLAVSEYPSWSLFLSASDMGLIDGRPGKLGPIESKWGVDIELKDTDYDSCILLYGNGQVDAACLTDMDSLPPSLSVPSVAILPTSTSDGADQCIVVDGIKTVDDLIAVNVYGLDNSVSRYCFDRNLELAGKDPDKFKFVSQDPQAATIALQQGAADHKAIMVWNPFCMEVKRQRKGLHTLFSSSSIKGEIIDMVTMSRKSLEKKGGKDFASAVADTYYAFCKGLIDAKTRDRHLKELGSRFAKLDLASMTQIVEETRFYDTPEKGLALFGGEDLPKVMQKVTAFCVKRGIVKSAPSVAYGDDPKANLCFDPQYIKAAAARK